MPITAEQAQQELRRRQAIAELQKRGTITAPEPNLPTSDQTRGLPGQPGVPSIPDTELITQLKGRLPGEQLSWFERAGPPDIVRLQQQDLKKRQDALNELKRRGYDEEQLKTIVGVRNITQRMPIGRMIGGTAGGALGGTLLAEAAGKIPPFTFLPEELITRPLFAAIGAGIMGAGGQAAQTGLEERRTAGIRELFRAGGAEVLYELGGRYGVIGAKMVFSPLIKHTVPEAAEIIRKYGDNAIQFSPAQLDKRLHLKVAESISRGSFFTDDNWRLFGEKQLQGVRGIAEQVGDSMVEGAVRQPPEVVGKIFAEGISSHKSPILKWMSDLFDPLYKQVDELTKGVKVSTQPLKALAKRELAIDSRMMTTGKGIHLTDSGRQTMSKIMNLKDAISHSDMRLIRSDYLAEARQLAREVSRDEVLIKELASAADEAIFNPSYLRSDFRVSPGATIEAGGSRIYAQGEAVYKGLTPEARRLLENTNRLYRETMIGLQNTFPEKLAKAVGREPGNFGKYVFAQKNPEAVYRLKQALIEPISGIKSEEGRLLWNQLRQAWYTDLLEKSTKEAGLSHVSYYNALKKMGASLDVMYNPAEREGIEDVGKIFKILKVGSSAGTPLFTKGVQIGGIVTAYQGLKTGNVIAIGIGGTLAIGPEAFAKIATTPAGSKLLTAGFSLKKGQSSQLIPIVARMVKLLSSIDRQEMDQMMQAKEAERVRLHQQRYPPRQPSLQEQRGFGGRGF